MELKERVQLRMGPKFDEQSFNDICTEVENGTFNSKAMLLVKKNTSHSPSYQITGDNLDLHIKVKHMGSLNQNNDIHWFNLNAVQNRVQGNHLDNAKPIKSILDMENVDFLPSGKDNHTYLHDITALATRVVVKNIPALSCFNDVIVHHIPHQYSDIMKEKSKQVTVIIKF